MSLKTIAGISLVLAVSPALQAADTGKHDTVIPVKEISSISVGKNYRQITINADSTLYRVSFEKPCTALRRSDVPVNGQLSENLSAGAELKVGTGSCVIKDIERDIDLPAITTARDPADQRQVLAGPTEGRQAR